MGIERRGIHRRPVVLTEYRGVIYQQVGDLVQNAR